VSALLLLFEKHRKGFFFIVENDDLKAALCFNLPDLCWALIWLPVAESDYVGLGLIVTFPLKLVPSKRWDFQLIYSNGDLKIKKRYTEEQIIKAIKRHEAGSKVENICRELGISNGTFCNWRSKFAGLEVNEAKRLRELESKITSSSDCLRTSSWKSKGWRICFKKVVKPTDKKQVVWIVPGWSEANFIERVKPKCSWKKIWNRLLNRGQFYLTTTVSRYA